jgi:EAL domain-containing protein (putative c-di-GMP-specific phosphodiesterase class I)
MIAIEKIIESGIGVFFQPIVSVRTKSLTGFESLARAVDPDTGDMIPPTVLFSAAAKAGKLLELDRACRKSALDAFSPFHRKNPSLLLFMNFESAIIDMPAAGSGHLLRSVRDAGIDSRNIVIEIVESKVNDSAAMRVFTESHRAEGFLIAIDDMGEGHSNLNRIPLLRPDIMKIDRSITHGISREYYHKKIVEALCVLARGTGALLLAEGVETEEDAVASYEAGADLFQGFFFSRPVPPHEAEADFLSSVETISVECRRRAAEVYRGRLTSEEKFRAVLEGLAAEIAGIPPVMLPDQLRCWLRRVPGCECVYLLDRSGRQTGPTVCAETARGAGSRYSLLYHPADSGTDHSLKEYYCMMKTLRVDSFISEPYISLATGSVCRTATLSFPRFDGDGLILCADFRCME